MLNDLAYYSELSLDRVKAYFDRNKLIRIHAAMKGEHQVLTFQSTQIVSLALVFLLAPFVTEGYFLEKVVNSLFSSATILFSLELLFSIVRVLTIWRVKLVLTKQKELSVFSFNYYNYLFASWLSRTIHHFNGWFRLYRLILTTSLGIILLWTHWSKTGVFYLLVVPLVELTYAVEFRLLAVIFPKAEASAFKVDFDSFKAFV